MAFNHIKDFKKEWISHKIDAIGIAYLEEFGLFLCDKQSKEDRFPGFASVSTSQLRNLFSEVKRIELRLSDESNDWRTEILMLRPKIAYTTARTLQRTKNSRMKELREVFEMCLSEITKEEDVKRFSQFFEAIIAYHKVNGGKD